MGKNPITAAALSKIPEWVSLKYLAQEFDLSLRTLETWSPHIVGRKKFGRLVRFHLPTINKVISEGRNPFSIVKGGR